MAREAGAVLRDRARSAPTGVGTKSSDTDPVTDADRAAESLIVDRLKAARPGDAIVAEESASVVQAAGERPDTSITWYVDPLDGTTNYLYGLPHWAVSVACADATGTLAGVVYDVLRDECFSAERGGGASCNGRSLAVRPGGDLATALVATGFSYGAAERAAQAEVAARVIGRVRDLRRAGSATLDLAWVAAGRLDAYFEVARAPWDWAAGALLVREAGGRISWTEHDEIVASGPAVHAALLALLRDAHEFHG